MPRRALQPGDIVAACNLGDDEKQVDLYDLLGKSLRLFLREHDQYQVVERNGRTLVVQVPGDSSTSAHVRSSKLRMWNNPLERRWRKEHGR